jgi:arylsulfatase A-like enzyme
MSARCRAGLIVLTSISIALFLAGCPGSTIDTDERAGAHARNVILISLDTLRADHLGVYGYDKPTSPSLDALAARGAVFLDAVAVSPWTLPSHATMLTGLYPLHHGARSYHTRLSDSVPSLAEIFSHAGFETAAVVSSQFIDRTSGLDRGFAVYHYVQEFSQPASGPKRPRNPGALVSQEALRWLSQRSDRPFFLFLHYYDAHSNYAPKRKYRRAFVTPGERSPINGTTLQLMQVLSGKRTLSESDLERLIALYDAEIRQLDDEIQKLLNALDESGLRESTLILVTSDHGEEFMEHGGVLHARTYYTEVISVPFLMAGPGVPQAWRGELPISHIDVAPTLLSLAGLAVPKEMAGIDLSRLWRESSASVPDRYLFAEADHSNAQPDQYRMVLGPR